jgi:hypothetical protein|tara:strand:- start:342 stop:656 length:315 start_codon:yes stop_codon:yes gene_type:complete
MCELLESKLKYAAAYSLALFFAIACEAVCTIGIVTAEPLTVPDVSDEFTVVHIRAEQGIITEFVGRLGHNNVDPLYIFTTLEVPSFIFPSAGIELPILKSAIIQ